MTNIPTDLLRTLVAVVDMRSFTKAALQLGVTQPAVSAQIKRLQGLLGGELFDRTSQGVALTPQGEMVVSYARRLLSINDQIVHIGETGPRPELVIRVGTPSEFIASMLPTILARFRASWPEVRFIVRTDHYESLLRELRNADIDVYVGLSINAPPDARHSWQEEVVWVRGPQGGFNIERPVPLVSNGERSVYHRIAVTALRAAGMDWEDVFVAPSLSSISAAVSAGLGVTTITRRRAADLNMAIWDDTPLPKLPDIFGGIYVREGGVRSAYEQLSDAIAEAITKDRPGARKITSAA